jgi:endonuclease III
MLLCRTRKMQALAALKQLFARWPTAGDLARADAAEVEAAVRSCGFHRQRARQLVRFSGAYLTPYWNRLEELPGIGVYVADAVGLVCFGCTELRCNDGPLNLEANRVAHDRGIALAADRPAAGVGRETLP